MKNRLVQYDNNRKALEFKAREQLEIERIKEKIKNDALSRTSEVEE